jgi:hypothetical protein
MDRWIRPFGARRERLEKGVDEDCQRKDKDKEEKLEREERERVLSYARPPSSGRTSTMQLGPLIGSWFFFFLISPFFLI